MPSKEEYYAFCRSKKCDYIQLFDTTDNPPNKFCKKCLSPMLTKCTNCGQKREAGYPSGCPHCGKPWK